ncbi:MAG: type II secretion system F family protein [Candidatus Eremiobacterota bacterium]
MNEQDFARQAMIWLDGAVRPERAAVIMRDPGQAPRVLTCHGMEPSRVLDGKTVNPTLLNRGLSGVPLVVCDEGADSEDGPLKGMRAVLCCPVRLGPRLALLYADHEAVRRPFNRSHLLKVARLAVELERRYGEPVHSPAAGNGEAVLPTRPAPVRISARARTAYLRCLHALEAGIMVDRALLVLSQGGEQPALARVSSHMASGLRQGRPLSWVMGQHERVFTPAQVAMVRLGENTGKLDRMLGMLADVDEKNTAILQRIRSALIYPAFLLGICLLLLVFGLPLMLQGHFKLLSESGQSLPWITVVARGMSWLLSEPLTWAVLLTVSWAGLRLWDSPRFRRILRRVTSRIPKVGDLVRLSSLTAFIWSWSSALEAGCRLLPALELSAQASGDPDLEAAVQQACHAMVEGEPVERALRATGYFPSSVLETVRAGTESGTLPETLRCTARLMEAELSARCETFVALAEPLALGSMGLVAGFFALAVMLPLTRVLEAL